MVDKSCLLTRGDSFSSRLLGISKASMTCKRVVWSETSLCHDFVAGFRRYTSPSYSFSRSFSFISSMRKEAFSLPNSNIEFDHYRFYRRSLTMWTKWRKTVRMRDQRINRIPRLFNEAPIPYPHASLPLLHLANNHCVIPLLTLYSLV